MATVTKTSSGVDFVQFLRSDDFEDMQMCLTPTKLISVSKESNGCAAGWRFKAQPMGCSQQRATSWCGNWFGRSPEPRLVSVARAVEESIDALLGDPVLDGKDGAELKSKAEYLEQDIFNKLLDQGYIKVQVIRDYKTMQAKVTVLKAQENIHFVDFDGLLANYLRLPKGMEIVPVNY